MAVLCHNPEEHQQTWDALTAAYGIPVVSFQSVDDLISFAIDDAPLAVLVDFSHQPRKVFHLPEVLRSILNLQVICMATEPSLQVSRELAKQPYNQSIPEQFSIETLQPKITPLLSLREQEFARVSRNEHTRLAKEIYQQLGESVHFGEVHLRDQAQALKEKRERRDQQIKSDQTRKEKALLKASEKVLQRLMSSQNVENSGDFRSSTLAVYIVEFLNYRGLICIGINNENQKDQERLLSFGSMVQNQLEGWGITAELTGPLKVEKSVEKFVEMFSSFSEFVLSHRRLDSHFAVAFVQRESVRPNLLRSSDGTMFQLNIKNIPTKTRLPFDCYLKLPKNNKYVKYVKAGNLISLDQVHRHTHEFEQSYLYVPVEQENQVLGFYTSQTLDWELATNALDIQPLSS